MNDKECLMIDDQKSFIYITVENVGQTVLVANFGMRQ